jgi:hypothetical protein
MRRLTAQRRSGDCVRVLPVVLVLSALGFESLGPGVEYAVVQLKPGVEAHVVRVDANDAGVELGLATSASDGVTCDGWATRKGWVAAINAGMYETDYLTNVGHLEHAGKVNQRRWNAYQSVLLLGPKQSGLPPAQLVDRDTPSGAALIGQYSTVVQNLRLSKGPGVNVWKPNGTPWPESFVAQDRQGRLLLGFVVRPIEMAELVDLLLGSELGVVRAMHVEGGPPACFSVRAGPRSVNLTGVKASFLGGAAEQRAIPNALGIRVRR